MTANPVEVYRTTDPAILAAFAAALADVDAWTAAVSEHAAAAMPGGVAISRTIGGGSRAYVGVSPAGGGPLPEVAGWRVPSGERYLVPDRRYTEGRAAARRIAALGVEPNPRRALEGMPVEARLGSRLHSCGVVPGDGEVMVLWGVPVSDVRPPDPARWERVPLSRWHARAEALAAITGADA